MIFIEAAGFHIFLEPFIDLNSVLSLCIFLFLSASAQFQFCEKFVMRGTSVNL